MGQPGFADDTSTLETSEDLRAAVYGASRFTIAIGLTSNLSLSCITTALHLLHRSGRHISLIRAERKILGVACISLAWKHWEDRDGVKSSHKLRDLCKSYYLLNAHSSEWRSNRRDDLALQEAATQWVCDDEGREMEKLRERIKTYELIILRACNFEVAVSETELLNALLCKSLRKLVPGIQRDATTYDALYTCALGVVTDFLRWPTFLEHDIRTVCGAAALKAVITMQVAMCTNVLQLKDSQLDFFNDQDIGATLENIRKTYEWATVIEKTYSVTLPT